MPHGKRTTKLYLIGRDADECPIYGSTPPEGGRAWARPMTLKQAKEKLARFPDSKLWKIAPVEDGTPT